MLAPRAVLTASNQTLTLTLEKGNWCSVELTDAGSRRRLGAETVGYIVSHLSSFLSDGPSAQRWILSLSEEHVSLYGESTVAAATLRLQDADGKMFAMLLLSQEDKQQWLSALSALR